MPCRRTRERTSDDAAGGRARSHLPRSPPGRRGCLGSPGGCTGRVPCGKALGVRAQVVDQIHALRGTAEAAERRAHVRAVMRRMVRDVQHRLPYGKRLLDVPGDAHVPHAATQVIVGQAVEVSGPAALDLLPPLGDRAQIGEVATGWQRYALLALPTAEPDLLGPHDVSKHVMYRAGPEPARDRARLVQSLGGRPSVQDKQTWPGPPLEAPQPP